MIKYEGNPGDHDPIVATDSELIEQNRLMETALAVAVASHTGQVDFGGEPIILHVLRVYFKASTYEEKLVALLHDCVEDAEDRRGMINHLYELGFSRNIVEAVVALSRDKEEEYLKQYIPRVAMNPLAARIKLIDLEDNLNVARILPHQYEEVVKYFMRNLKAREILRREPGRAAWLDRP